MTQRFSGSVADGAKSLPASAMVQSRLETSQRTNGVLAQRASCIQKQETLIVPKALTFSEIGQGGTRTQRENEQDQQVIDSTSSEIPTGPLKSP